MVIIFALLFSIPAFADSDLTANNLLRREVVRLTLQDADNTPELFKMAPPALRAFNYGALALGAGAQGSVLLRFFFKPKLLGKIKTRDRVSLGALGAANLVLTSYLLNLGFDGIDLTHDHPFVTGVFQIFAAATLATPQGIASAKRFNHYYRGRTLMWIPHGYVWSASYGFAAAAAYNFSAAEGEIAQHVQLSPDQFECPTEEQIANQVFEERAYALGVDRPRDVAVLKEHMKNPLWLEKLPLLNNEKGEPIVPENRIEKFTTLAEAAKSLALDTDSDDIHEPPKDFLKQERVVYEALIREHVEMLKSSGRKSSADRAEKVLRRVRLITGTI